MVPCLDKWEVLYLILQRDCVVSLTHCALSLSAPTLSAASKPFSIKSVHDLPAVQTLSEQLLIVQYRRPVMPHLTSHIVLFSGFVFILKQVKNEERKTL